MFDADWSIFTNPDEFGVLLSLDYGDGEAGELSALEQDIDGYAIVGGRGGRGGRLVQGVTRVYEANGSGLDPRVLGARVTIDGEVLQVYRISRMLGGAVLLQLGPTKSDGLADDYIKR